MTLRLRMPRGYVPSLALTVAAIFLISGVVQSAAQQVRLRYVPNEYIVHVKAGTSIDDVQNMMARIGGRVKSVLPIPNAYVVKIGSGTANVRRSSSRVVWSIESIRPNYYAYACDTTVIPDDKYWDKLWGMKMINAPQAWYRFNGPNVMTPVVAVVDSGVSNHPDFGDFVFPGKDFVVPDNLDGRQDLDGHGTHVTGTIAATGDNTIGVCGVNWDGLKILPVRVLDQTGTGTYDAIISGLYYCLTADLGDPDLKVNVVNMSIAGPDDPDLHTALQTLDSAGILLVAAAGNDGRPRPSYPAAYDECISVAAVGPNRRISFYSNYGTTIDIAAPGGSDTFSNRPDDEIWSTTVTWDTTVTPPTPSYGYGPMQGTSMACPHVAGAAAYLLRAGVGSDLDPVDRKIELRKRLLENAGPPNDNPYYYGAGILDLNACLNAGSVKILKPARGSTSVRNVDVKIQLKNIDITTVKVLFDYPDTDSNGKPDGVDGNGDGVPDGNEDYVILENIDPSNGDTIKFTLPLEGEQALAEGSHRLWVTGKAVEGPFYGGPLYSDFCVFNVTDQIIKAGIHLFAFPYCRDILGLPGTVPAGITPGDILTEVSTGLPVKFPKSGANRAYLTRWLPRTSVNFSVPYYQYSDDKLPAAKSRAEKMAWDDPEDWTVINGTEYRWYTGGGYSTSSPDTFKFPAGAGYWLYVPRDVLVNQSYGNLSADSAFNVYLYQGWNMVGNPFSRNIAWGSALFTYRGEGPKMLLEAERAGWVQSNLFSWNSTYSRYEQVTPRDFLQPYMGYWLYANVGGVTSSDQLTVTFMP